MRVTDSSRFWVYRFTSPTKGKLRELGLGSADTVSLKAVRKRAQSARECVAAKLDPISERERERQQVAEAAARDVWTFDKCAEQYIATHASGWKNEKHAAQWRATLKAHASPTIGLLPVADVERDHVKKILQPLWHTKTETASRLRGRIEAVLAWAIGESHRSEPNPAAWKPLKASLGAPRAIKKAANGGEDRHHASLAYAELPAFWSELAKREGVAAAALRFVMLTGCRTSEVVGAKWSEIKGESWTVPASRMKGGKPHRVPLSDAALAVLETVKGKSKEFVFPGPTGSPLSTGAMLTLLRKVMKKDFTPHGFRSSFRTWAGEKTSTPREVCEAALAHVVGGVEAHYNVGDMFDRRRLLMDTWATFVLSHTVSDNVVPFGKTAS